MLHTNGTQKSCCQGGHGRMKKTNVVDIGHEYTAADSIGVHTIAVEDIVEDP